MSVKLYLLQRISAMIMAPLVLVHLIIITYAMRSGLSATAILDRTQGSLVWGLVYGTFVLVIAIHGAIGIRVVISEWFGLQEKAQNILMWGVGVVLLLLGSRAVIAVTF